MRKKYDAVLIGGGIMTATLGVLLKELMPQLSIGIFERLEKVASESSDAWNNAGTGHSAFCELNYTPENESGEIDVKKAIKIASQFEESLQFWSYLVAEKILKKPNSFINSVPHISFVWGNENVEFLKKRYEALSKSTLFKGMKYSENVNTLKIWMPLVMQNRPKNIPFAATNMPIGTDINFGELTTQLINYLDNNLDSVDVFLAHEVTDLKKIKPTELEIGLKNLKELVKPNTNKKNIDETYNWELEIEDLKNNDTHHIQTNFVFIGAGGAALPLLEKSDIEEAEGYGGFPISGQWLRCKNEKIIENHAAKVYGKASVGSPPMSVPHLDTRIINGKKELLFGPFAGFSTKFLKKGSYLDLPKSIEFSNILPMISAGINNIPLTKYLVEQVMQSPEDRLNTLKEYFPDAKIEDWELIVAGQRVQVIKKDEEEGGVLEFGTELIASADGTIAGLLGASPGASTSVSIMLKVIKTCFAQFYNSDQFQQKLKTIIPSYNSQELENELYIKNSRRKTAKILELK